MNVLIVVTGSISAFKACSLVSMLRKASYNVRCVMSEGAQHLIGQASLEALSDNPVLTDLWAPKENMQHIRVRDWADLYLVYPASANRIAQFAHGLAPDLIGSLYLANNNLKPFWIAPAMNTQMLAHKATMDNLDRVTSHGARVFYGESGVLACGDIGAGRLVEPDVMFKEIDSFFRRPKNPLGRVLITGGAMTEKIDSVRSITNTSSGRTASTIASVFAQKGYEVDFLHHRSADLSATARYKTINFKAYESYADFSQSIFSLLSERVYDIVVHAAAVSDYSPRLVEGKLDSGKNETIELRPNPKILPKIRSHIPNQAIIVGFKLTLGESLDQGRSRAQKSIADGHADYIIWNDFGNKTIDTESFHEAVIFGRHTEILSQNNQDLAQNLVQLLAKEDQ